MTDKELRELFKYLSELITVVSNLKEKPKFITHKVGAEVNKNESLTSQEHYTIQDLIRTFIREKSEVIAMAKEVDDDDAPEFPVVDAHDDIIDITDKLESAELQQSVVHNVEEKTVESVGKIEPKVENTVVSEKSSTEEK